MQLTPNIWMNQLSFNIPLNQWCLGSTKDAKPRCLAVLALGSQPFEMIEHLVESLSKKLFSEYTFVILDANDAAQSVEIALLSKQGFLDFDPPIRIKSMKRGIVANSVKFYTLYLEFCVYISDALKLMQFIETHVSKDLVFQFNKGKKETTKEDVFE
jgi:hypothetical protein